MMTTLSAMRPARIQNSIIGALLALLMALLSGCGTVRLAYNNAPQLAWWWVDAYVDFSRAQAPQVRQALDAFFTWHRSTQLADFLPLLTRAQVAVQTPLTPQQACGWEHSIREQLEPTLVRALTLAADQLPGLGEPQYRHLEQHYAKLNAEIRDDFLQPDPAKRQAAAVKRVLDRVELLYGSLDEPQLRVVREGVAASPFDAELWLAERQRRQRDTVQTLRRLQAERADADQRLLALRALVARSEKSPDARYRAYQIELETYNCGFAASIHNATTAEQRLKGRDRLEGWKDDVRALLAG